MSESLPSVYLARHGETAWSLGYEHNLSQAVIRPWDDKRHVGNQPIRECASDGDAAMSTEALSRTQFALTASSHSLFPPLSIGLGDRLLGQNPSHNRIGD
jgi:hypothetical protein